MIEDVWSEFFKNKRRAKKQATRSKRPKLKGNNMVVSVTPAGGGNSNHIAKPATGSSSANGPTHRSAGSVPKSAVQGMNGVAATADPFVHPMRTTRVSGQFSVDAVPFDDPSAPVTATTTVAKDSDEKERHIETAVSRHVRVPSPLDRRPLPPLSNGPSSPARSMSGKAVLGQGVTSSRPSSRLAPLRTPSVTSPVGD